MAYKMAIINRNVDVDIIEATEFPELTMRYMVMGVPLTEVNGVRQVRGFTREETYVQQIVEALSLIQPTAS